MDPSTVHVVLRVIHILAGVVWVGAAFILAVYVIPSVRAAGPSGGAVTRQITQVRKMPVLMTWVTWLTVLSGVALYWRLSNGFAPAFFRTGVGVVFGIGGLLGIAGMVLGMAVSSPTSKKLGALGAAIAQAGGTPTTDQVEENAKLQARLLMAGRAGAVILLASTVAMAVARYV